MLTTYQKSKLLWIGGGVLGGVIGHYAFKTTGKETLGATILGMVLVGMIGDKALENKQEKDLLSLSRAATCEALKARQVGDASTAAEWEEIAAKSESSLITTEAVSRAAAARHSPSASFR